MIRQRLAFTPAFKREAASLGMVCSSHAAYEGLFSQLKRERVGHQSYRTRGEARADLFDYIERLHNRECVVGSPGKI